MSASIIKNRNFAFMWFGHLISHAGDAVFMIALPWLMLDITGSKSLTSLVSMSAYLPAVLFGLFAGVVVDRYNRKWIMIYSDILRALLVAVIPLSLIYGFISPLLIGAITFSLSTFSAFFYPARDSLIPHIVTAEELPAANSAISVSGQMSHLLGPLFAGIGISIFGLRHLFTADAISFLFSILLISLIVGPARKLTIEKHPPKWQGIVEGLTYVNSHKGLRILLILTFVNNIFIMGPAIIGLPVFVREVLTSDFGVLAKLEVAMAAGMIVGSFVFWKAEKNISPISILLFGIVMDGITYTLLFFADTSFIAILVLIIHGIGIPLITVSRTTIIQAVVPDEFRGRLFSMIYMAVMGTTAISVGLTGFILEFIGADSLFLLIGVGAASTVIIGFNPALREMNVNNRFLDRG
ncbi:uncharacterized protein METZ01_LOCUS45404 [marine metagenome]|uniref:Major facilitator superfamily (MFS) profile domain-containing protein n=1 Tax=marine metagenome TaxID=408172 RepID=A0A381RL25_9ZZZZ